MSLASDDTTFSRHMAAVAQKFWDKPNVSLCTPTELRWGSHGSKSVDLEKGVWSDHEAKEGGGVLDLVRRERRCSTGEALDWLRDEIGADIEDRRERRAEPAPKARVVAEYDYTDEDGCVVFQVCRMEPKTFRQRRPDPSAAGGWNWSVKGVRQVPYRLTDVLEAIAQDRTIFIAEGEKDVDQLWRAGIPATCNAGGAGKWPEGLSEFFTGADVIVLPDNDDAGRNHAAVVGAALRQHARSVRTLPLPGLPPKGDVSDWLAAGNSAATLYDLAEREARAWTPAPPQSRFGAIQWADVDTVPVRQDWLIEDMMFSGDIGMTYGASGSGKSFLMVHAGICIARVCPSSARRPVRAPCSIRPARAARVWSSA